MAETIHDLQTQITKLETELKELYQEDERLCQIIAETKTQKAILEKTIQKQNEVINLLTQIIELYANN